MPPRTLVIVNPASRNGRTRKTFVALERQLRDRLGPLEIDWTRTPRDAERLAREGARAGVERIVVAGGDGTASEVVAGVLAADLGDRVEIGLLPLGTGADLNRGLGLPMDLDQAIEGIAEGRTRRIDAGRIDYQDLGGKARSTRFINSATVGISGLVCAMVNQTSKRLGGTVSFLAGTLRALVRFQPPPVELRLDGEVIHSGPIVLATANNGPYFGGGMYAAPRARFDDGLLDVVVIPGLSKAMLIRKLPRLYTGSHIDVPGVLYRTGRKLEARAIGPSTELEVDGEPLGQTPARFEVLPDAITLVGASETR